MGPDTRVTVGLQLVEEAEVGVDALVDRDFWMLFTSATMRQSWRAFASAPVRHSLPRMPRRS
jgi:hypothetical protein